MIDRGCRAVSAVLTVALIAVSGCAARGSGPGRTAAPETRPADKVPAASPDTLQEHIRKVRHLSAGTSSRQATFGATVEGLDRRLAEALLVETVLPSAESHLLVAEEYRRLGILDSAHTRLNRALQRDPRFAAAHEAMARVWRDWGLPGLGLSSAYRATFYAPDSASARNTLGTILNALGELDGARKAYMEAAALDPTAGWALSNLCYLEFTRARHEVARGYCEEALRLSPALVAAHNNLALTYAASGDMIQAEEAFRAAGDAAAAEYNMGIMHLATGQHASAGRAFEKAIDLRPTFTAAKERAHVAKMTVVTGHQ